MNLKNTFYQDKEGNDKFNEQCINCPYLCKQSYRVSIMSCKLLKENKNKNGKKK